MNIMTTGGQFESSMSLRTEAAMDLLGEEDGGGGGGVMVRIAPLLLLLHLLLVLRLLVISPILLNQIMKMRGGEDR